MQGQPHGLFVGLAVIVDEGLPHRFFFGYACLVALLGKADKQRL